MSGDAKNTDVLTSSAFPLEQGAVYRAVVDVGGTGGLLGATEYAIGKVIEALTDRGFAGVRAWPTSQYAELPPDWPRSNDPPGAGDVFPDWTIRLQGTWNAPSVTLPRQLDDVQSGTVLSVRRAWRYDAAAAPAQPAAPLARPTSSPGEDNRDAIIVAAVIAAVALAATLAVWYVAASKPKRRRRRDRHAG